MSYIEFDQTDGQGWRKYTTTGTKEYTKAAEIIEYYIANKKDIPIEDIYMLHWHAGQMYAEDNKYPRALLHFRKAYLSGEDLHDKYWNCYVRATIAFLNKDLDSLRIIKAAMSELPEIDGMHTNLAFVRSFIRNIDKPYSFAYKDVINNLNYKE
ncbi:MAG: hypothetical protein ACM3Q2_01815 [Syntrophothermus sp.]